MLRERWKFRSPLIFFALTLNTHSSIYTFIISLDYTSEKKNKFQRRRLFVNKINQQFFFFFPFRSWKSLCVRLNLSYLDEYNSNEYFFRIFSSDYCCCCCCLWWWWWIIGAIIASGTLVWIKCEKISSRR